MAIDFQVIEVFEQCFKKYQYDEQVIGKLAHSEFKTGVKKGDEVDVIMPASVALFPYTGGNLKDAEEVTTSTTKIRIDKGYAFHFEIDEVKQKVIENCKDVGQRVNLIKEYSSDAIKQFAANVDKAYADLYTRAGHVVTGSGSNGEVVFAGTDVQGDALKAKQLLNQARILFQRGDRAGHNNWVDGQMVAIVPPEFEYFLGLSEDYVHVESGHKKIEKGFVGKLGGWDIMISNNCSVDGNGNHHLLFGQRGKTLAGGVSANLNTKSYMPELNFNTRYKGYGLFGVGAPRADLLGTAAVNMTMGSL